MDNESPSAWYDGFFRPDLFALAESCATDEDYTNLKARLQEDGDIAHDLDGMSEQDQGCVEHYSTLLNVLFGASGDSLDIPLDLVKVIVEKGGVELLAKTDGNGDTPLHLIAARFPNRNDIAAYLVQQVPDIVNCRNRMLFRPIDLVAFKVIMLDEYQKYGGEGDTQAVWETIYTISRASRPDIEIQQPLVHSCVVSPDFPVALLQRAVKRYPEQLKAANDLGDLPLHLMISKYDDNHDEEDDDDDAAMKLFALILKGNISAATTLNQKGLSPLALALQTGHGLNSSIVRTVLSLAPASIETLNVSLPALPFLFERLTKKDLWSASFSLLKTKSPAS